MLYTHSQDLRRVLPLLERTRPLYAKAIDPDAASAARCAELGIRLIVRHYQEPRQTDAQAFVNDCAAQAWFPWAWAIENHNEPFPGQDVPQWYIDFEAACVRWFAVYGKDCVVGNRANGHDGYYVPGAVYYGTHEYGWPFVMSDAPFMALRHRSWFPAVLARNPQARLFITEFGVTQAVLPGHADVGWRSEGGPSLEDYWAGVLAYIAELHKTPYVLGAFLFQVGGFPDWSTFEGLPELGERWPSHEASLSESPQNGPQGHPGVADGGGADMPEFVLGFRDLADRLGRDVVGEPQVDERTLRNADGSQVLTVQVTSKGMMVYQEGGQPVFLSGKA